MDLRKVYIWVWAALCVATFLYYAVDAHAHHAGISLDADASTQKYIKFAYQYYRQPQGCSHAVIGTPPEPYDHNGIAWGAQGGCDIWIRPDTVPWAPSPFTRREREYEYCGAILHEVGHNLGLNHVTGNVESPMNVEHPWNHPGCWAPYHVLHRHKHVHWKRIHGKLHRVIHWHKHYHLKVGQP